MEQDSLPHRDYKPLKTRQRKDRDMPILLWLLGIPIPLIILIMLLHH